LKFDIISYVWSENVYRSCYLAVMTSTAQSRDSVFESNLVILCLILLYRKSGDLILHIQQTA